MLHSNERPECVFGNGTVWSEIKPNRFLNIVSNDDVRAMQPEDSYSKPMLNVEAGEIITSPDIIGKREKRVLMPIAVIKDRTLADPQRTGGFFFLYHGTNTLDARDSQMRFLIEMDDPS